MSRDRRQGCRRDGDPEDPERKLHEAKGIIQPRDGTFSLASGKPGIHQDIDLGGSQAYGPWSQEQQDSLDSGMAKI